MVGLERAILADGDGAGANETVFGHKEEMHETAHSSYSTYVFGTIRRTLSVSEGRRKATYTLGRMTSCIVLFLVEAVARSKDILQASATCHGRNRV